MIYLRINMNKSNKSRWIIGLIIGLSFVLGIWITQQGGLRIVTRRIISEFIPSIKAGQFILKKYNGQCADKNGAGDLWVYSKDQKYQKQMTNGLCVGEILELSPKGQYVLVEINDWNNGSRTTSLAAVELATGITEILRDGEKYHNYRVGYWLSDKEIVDFIPTKENTIEIEAINIKNKDSKIIGEWPIGVLFSGNQPFSEDKQWAVGNGYSMDEQKPYTFELFSYDQTSKTKNSIINGPFINFITWLGNKIVYTDKVDGKNTIWVIDASGLNKEKLGNLEGEDISNFAVAGNHKRIVYSVKTKQTNTPEIDVDHNWFSFDLISKENKKIALLNESFVAIQSLSRDGNSGVFVKKDSHELFIVDLASFKSDKLCWAGDNCQVVWP